MTDWGRICFAYGFDCIPHGAHTFGQCSGILPMPTDMHEVHWRTVEDEMIMQSGYIQAVGKGGIHGRRDFVFEDYRIAHHHDAARHGLERGPATEACRRWYRHAIHCNGHVVTAPLDTHYAVSLNAGLHSGCFVNNVGI